MHVGMHCANALAIEPAISLVTNAGAMHLARLAMRIASTLQRHVQGALHPAFSPAMRTAIRLLTNTGATHPAHLAQSITSTLRRHVQGSLHPAFSPAMKTANSLLENIRTLHVSRGHSQCRVQCASHITIDHAPGPAISLLTNARGNAPSMSRKVDR